MAVSIKIPYTCRKLTHCKKFRLRSACLTLVTTRPIPYLHLTLTVLTRLPPFNYQSHDLKYGDTRSNNHNEVIILSMKYPARLNDYYKAESTNCM